MKSREKSTCFPLPLPPHGLAGVADRCCCGAGALGVNNGYHFSLRCARPRGHPRPSRIVTGCLYVSSCFTPSRTCILVFFIGTFSPRLVEDAAFVKLSTLFRSFRLRSSSPVYVKFTTPSSDVSRYPVILANSSNFWRGSGMKRDVNGLFFFLRNVAFFSSNVPDIFQHLEVPCFSLFISFRITLKVL